MKTPNKPPADEAIKKWISENYGVISKVARDMGVSAQHCWYVCRGIRTSRDLRIERALKALGCPIVAKIN